MLYCISGSAQNSPKPDRWLKLAEKKAMYMLSQLSDTTRYPRSFKLEKGITLSKTSGWTSGFFPGILWFLYRHTQKDYWKNEAHRWTAALEKNNYLDWRTHDLGFMMYNSFGKAYQFTQDPSYKQILITAADSLSQMFNPTVGTTESWPWRKNWSHPTIIDNMLNLELLFWAGKNGGDKKLYEIALKHAQTTQKNHIRDDFSTWHVIDYDEATGKVRGKYTDQGLSDNSTWSRGQAWAVYGFTLAYRETKEEEFLNTAIQLTEVFLKNLPEDLVPYWDFDVANVTEPRDASAACVFVSALLELHQYVKADTLRQNYQDKASEILNSLGKNYLNTSKRFPFLIEHCTGSKPHNSEIDVPLIYADYYFIEALWRWKKWIQKS